MLLIAGTIVLGLVWFHYRHGAHVQALPANRLLKTKAAANTGTGTAAGVATSLSDYGKSIASHKKDTSVLEKKDTVAVANKEITVPDKKEDKIELVKKQEDKCHVDEHNEYHGDVVKWGAENLQATAGECCASCSATPGCNVWVWCGQPNGCGGSRPFKECWLKKAPIDNILSNYKKGHEGISWTAGAIYTEEEATAWRARKEEKTKAEAKRLQALKDDPEMPLVYLEVMLSGEKLGRIEIVPFVKTSPRAAENLRVLCSGEKTENGVLFTLKGSTFYRIIDRFIDQTGAKMDGIYGGTFLDDIGGIKLTHDRMGLCSTANMGPNTNGGHFSLMMGPAHHLDGNYVIFGEAVTGHDILEKVNLLSKGQKNNEMLNSNEAVIVDVGQIRRGTYIEKEEYKDVVASEHRRVEYNKNMDPVERARLNTLWNNQDLPLVYMEVAIKGRYYGRISMVLFAKESPLASENFRLLITGEAGTAPPDHEGAGQPYHFKGMYFYRIIGGFIDQTGAKTDSPLGGLFLDDVEGLKLNHTHKGLLSMANIGPNTNGAHFSMIMGPQPHLNTHYTVFGEIVDGLHVAEAINDLAKQEKNNEHSNTQDAQIIDCGELRRGKIMQGAEFKSIIEKERARIKRTWQAPPKAGSS